MFLGFLFKDSSGSIQEAVNRSPCAAKFLSSGDDHPNTRRTIMKMLLINEMFTLLVLTISLVRQAKVTSKY